MKGMSALPKQSYAQSYAINKEKYLMLPSIKLTNCNEESKFPIARLFDENQLMPKVQKQLSEN